MAAKQLVESSVLVFKMGPAVKSTVGEFLYLAVRIKEIKYGAFCIFMSFSSPFVKFLNFRGFSS